MESFGGRQSAIAACDCLFFAHRGTAARKVCNAVGHRWPSGRGGCPVGLPVTWRRALARLDVVQQRLPPHAMRHTVSNEAQYDESALTGVQFRLCAALTMKVVSSFMPPLTVSTSICREAGRGACQSSTRQRHAAGVCACTALSNLLGKGPLLSGLRC